MMTIHRAWFVAGLLTLHAALLTWSAVSNSVCFDEYAHLPAGLSYVKYREFGMLNLSPPLLRMISAAGPMLFAKADIPPLEPYRGMVQKDRYWAYGEAFLRANSSDYQHLFVLARVAMIPISCLGAWIVYRWARDLYGEGGGFAACTAYVLCPNICAHASLVGTDVGITVTFVTAAWLWWRYCKRQRTLDLILATIAVAAAHLCKFSGLFLWPVLLVTAVIALPRWRVLTSLAIVAAGSLLLINAGYLFEGSAKPINDFRPKSLAMVTLFHRLPGRLPVPLPEQFVIGLDALKWEVEQQFPAYVLGEQYRGSRWYYFPVALALKLPLATIALLALATLTLTGRLRHGRASADEGVVIASLVIVILTLMFLAGVNLGVRYVLPALPFAFILIGGAWQGLSNMRRARWIVPALLALLLIENVSVAPRYLTFFNLAVGGPARGQFLLNDSNADWGQGLLDLKRWMDSTGVKRVHLAYFGRVDPATYGIDYDLITEPSGEPYVAISSYYLAGLPHRLPSRNGPTGPVQLPFYLELQRKPRVAIIGGVIHIFRRDQVAEAIAEHRGAR